jgi:hypothetical protein
MSVVEKAPPPLLSSHPCDFWCPICRRVVYTPRGGVRDCAHDWNMWHASVFHNGLRWIWSLAVREPLDAPGSWVLADHPMPQKKGQGKDNGQWRGQRRSPR